MNDMRLRTAQLQSNKQFHYLSRKIWGSFTKIMSRGKGMLEMAKIWLFGGTFLRLNSVPNTEGAVRNNMSDQKCWVNMLQEVNFHGRQKKKITRMTISILIQY